MKHAVLAHGWPAVHDLIWIFAGFEEFEGFVLDRAPTPSMSCARTTRGPDPLPFFGSINHLSRSMAQDLLHGGPREIRPCAPPGLTPRSQPRPDTEREREREREKRHGKGAQGDLQGLKESGCVRVALGLGDLQRRLLTDVRRL